MTEEKKKTILVLAIIVLVGVVLRFIGGLSTLLFTYDQSRDAFIALDILNGDLKIVGPASDIPGLFHGAINASRGGR